MNFLRLLRVAKQPAKIRISTTKCFSQHPLKFMETQDMWKEKDGVHRRYELIYKAPMDTALKYTTTYLTFSTASATALGAYCASTFDMHNIDTPIVIGDDVVIANSTLEFFTYIGAFVLLHIAVKVLLTKYVLRLYQNGDSYIAIFRGHMFNSIKKHEFSVDEFKRLKPTLVVSWGDSRFALGKKHAIILENYFKTPEYFNYLLYKRKSKLFDEEPEP